MLLQLTVENVLSFKDQAVLSLLAAPGVEHRPEHVVVLPGLSTPVLRVAAIYGPNASGKSNLLAAMVMARSLIVDGTRPGAPMAVVPFELDDVTRSRPSRMEVELWIDGHRWSYGFTCSTARVYQEWLLVDDGSGERAVFTRTNTDDGDSITIGDALPLTPERRDLWELVAEGTRPNQLFVAEARERNVIELAPLVTEIDHVTWIPPDSSVSLPKSLLRSPSLLTWVSSLLRDLGTGVDHVELVVDAPSGQQQRWNEIIRKISTEPFGPVDDPLLAEIADHPSLRLRFRHEAANEPIALDPEQESDGTIRLVQLAPIMFLVTGVGRTVLIDELDRSLHALLSRQLLQQFLDCSPVGRGQLIFTTHDTNLLDLTLLPRDSIWFTEKSHAGASTLYSLAEFDPKQLEQLGDDLERGYLSGRFGAIPFLANPRRLGWVKTKAS